MAKVNFKRGDFIRHIKNPEAYAIYGGDCLPPLSENDDFVDYSLICYYNKFQVDVVSDDDYSVKPVFSYDDGILKCNYVLRDTEANLWRKCLDYEKDKFIKMLRDRKYLEFDEENNIMKKISYNTYFRENLQTPPTTPTVTNTQTNVFHVVTEVDCNYIQCKKIGDNPNGNIGNIIDSIKPKETSNSYGSGYGYCGYSGYGGYNSYYGCDKYRQGFYDYD